MSTVPDGKLINSPHVLHIGGELSCCKLTEPYCIQHATTYTHRKQWPRVIQKFVLFVESPPLVRQLRTSTLPVLQVQRGPERIKEGERYEILIIYRL